MTTSPSPVRVIQTDDGDAPLAALFIPNKPFITKDSGERQTWDTGSQRDTRAGKGRYDLLPVYAVRRLAGLYERGSVKYGDRNWEKGQPLSRYVDSMLRHAFQVSEGATDEDHAAAVAWNALAIIETRERIDRGELPVELDDI